MDEVKLRLETCSRERQATLDLAGVKCGAVGAGVLATFLPKCWGLTSLLLSQSALLSKDAGNALANALATNQSLKLLDVSNNYDTSIGATDGPGFAQALAEGLAKNKSLTDVSISNNTLCGSLDSTFTWVPDMTGVIALCESINCNVCVGHC
jgi:hypothetical protein